MKTVILGAGFAGLSTSYHLGHAQCEIIESNSRPFGHAKSVEIGQFVWDEGPHVSFTKQAYVKNLFASAVNGEFDEYEVRIGNYYRGIWIAHPAQSNLYQLPEPQRSKCVAGFLARRPEGTPPTDYAEWLELAFGQPFARLFPAAYTRKYWTTEPSNLSTDWLGERIYRPSSEEIIAGASGPLPQATHYITTVRYPRKGGFQAFGRAMAADASIQYGQEVVEIDLVARMVASRNGRRHNFDRLISTLPLPVFVRLCRQATKDVLSAADALSCSQLLLVNIEVPHEARRTENWLYVYDEDKFSTRISFTEKMTAGNAPSGRSGIQVEVYASRFRPFSASPQEIAVAVVAEMYEMGLIDASVPRSDVRHSVNTVQWANVIFTRETRATLDTILQWLSKYGLERESDDLNPLTDWSSAKPVTGALCLAGRYGQWKYAWTDDCVMRGRQLAGIVD